MIEYEELRIRLWPVARHRAVVLMNGPHQAAGVVASSRLGSFRASFDAILDAEHGGHMDARPDDSMRVLGEELFAELLPEPLESCLYDSRETAAALNRRLRLRFELPGALSDIPVEALRVPTDRGGSLAIGSRMSIVRSVSAPGLLRGRLPGPRDEFEKLRVIVVVADPRRALPGQAVLPVLDLAAEVAALTAELDRSGGGLAVDHEMLGLGGGPPVTRAEIQAAVERTRGRPCVVVLLGHGAPAGAVYLEEPDGTPDPVTGHVLVGDLAGANVRLVVLNLCGGGRFEASRPYSAVGEELVVGGIPAVVAMQADVSDAAAALFTPTLFRTLRGNATLDEAVTRARNEMVDGGGGVTAEWVTPVVVVHRQTRHGWLFKVRGFLAPGGEPPHDPLASGAADLAAVDDARGGIDPGRLVGAARHARNDGDWPTVERLAAAGRGLRPELDALGWEAAFEAAADRIRRICDLLAAEGDPAPAAELLAAIRERLPGTVVACLEAEVAAARRAASTMVMARAAAAAQEWLEVLEYCEEVLADHPDGYQNATTLRDTAAAELDRARRYATAAKLAAVDDWTGAAAVFEQLATGSPGGFRDAAGWWHYCVGQRALEQGDLRSAVEAFRAAGDHADAVAHMETAAAQISMEEAGDWSRAVKHLRRAAAAGADVRRELSYVRAREMIDSGDWEGALRLLRGLVDDRPDVVDLTYLAAGMLAADRRDWGAVLRELDDLPDAYANGAVGGARRLARAGIAVDERRWDAALAELDGSAEPAAYEERRIAAVARAGLAEDRGDWTGAAAALRTLAGADGELDDRELTDMASYADGRAAEAKPDWSGAEAAYAGVRPAHRDAGSRRVYARGRAAEDAGDLPAAIECYLQVLDAFEDVADRLVRCRLAEMVQRPDWDAVVGQAELLADPAERAAWTGYARGRLAEEVADWDAAARCFAECRDHADAALREAYAQARADEAGGRWHRALGHYGCVAGEHRDVATRRDRLTACLTALPWADGLPDAGLAELPGADGPYAVLAPLGIGPGSSAREVNAAGFGVLRQRRGRGDQDGLQKLRNRSSRLAIDARMAVVRDPQALRAAMAALAPGPVPEMVAALRAAAPDDAGLVAMLGSGIEDALAEWDAAVRRDPADTTAARNLALIRERRTARLREAGDQEGAATEWLRCVGLWVMVLLDDDHWRTWGTARARRYGLAVADEELRTLRDGIADRLAQDADAAAPAADPGPGLTVHTERLAASLLGEVGGVAARHGPGSSRVVCGPARLADAGLVDRFAALVASLQPAPGDDPPKPGTTAAGGLDPSRLRCAFSGLGPSLTLLERGQSARALALLPEMGGDRLGTAATCTVAERRAGPDHRTGCAECRHFHDHHPAYLLLPNRTTQLVQDAAGLAVRAHVAVARTAALRDVPEIGAAVAALSEALVVSRAAGLAVRARDVVARAAYDLAEDLAARRGPGRADRLERSVELLQRLADGPLGGNARVRAAMADVLNQRGLLRAGRDDQERRKPDLAAAESDLRAAVRLNPAPSIVRANLAQIMVLRAEQRSERAPWTTVAAAADLVADGLGRAPGNGPLRSALAAVCDVAGRLALNKLSLDEVMELLGEPATGDAMTQERAGRHAQAIHLACSELQIDPDDERAQRVLRDLLRSRAGHERKDEAS